MLANRNLFSHNWLSGLSLKPIPQPTGVAEDKLSVVRGWLIGKLKARQIISLPKALVAGDRRKPAYLQLRQTWETLDEGSRREAVTWILQKTLIDPLSGLETLVAREVSGSKPEGWLEAISDLNALKAINDTWGHPAGDAIIRQLGNIVKNEVAIAGERAFRVGGDEITYWFPNVQTAARTLEKIATRFQAEVFVIEKQKYTGFSLSYGIGADLNTADKALYHDKERRKNLGQRSESGQLPRSIIICA